MRSTDLSSTHTRVAASRFGTSASGCGRHCGTENRHDDQDRKRAHRPGRVPRPAIPFQGARRWRRCLRCTRPGQRCCRRARAKTIGTYRDVSVQPWTPPSAQPTSPLLGADQVSTSAASSAHFRMRTVSMRSRSSSAVFWKRVP